MPDIVIETRDRVLEIQINRPEKKNAITAAMYTALSAALQEAHQDALIRAILLHGSGETFSAGHDIRDFLEHPPQSTDSPVYQFMTALGAAAKPVIAAVHGASVGIGATLLLHCDLIYAAEGTRFHLPFVDLGLVPEFGSSVLLPALAGHRRAAEYLMLGTPFDAAVARDIGLINHVVPQDRLLAKAREAAVALAAKPPDALRLTKMLMRRATAGVIEAAIQAEAQLFAERLVSREAREAFAAFLEKRRQSFPAE